MWGRRHRNKAKLLDDANAESLVIARARALSLEVEQFKGGKAVRAADEIQTDMFGFLIETLPTLDTSGIAALALIDIAPLSIQMASASEDWLTVSQAGAVLASAVVAVRQKSDRQSIDGPLERELGRFVGAHFDEFFYSLARLDKALDLGVFCDFVLEGGFAGRQFLQLADPEVRQAWDWATGMLANGGATLSDKELRQKLANGAWLSDRQRADLDPDSAVETMLTWAAEAMDVLTTVPSLSLVAKSDNPVDAWNVILEAVEKAQRVSPQMRLAFAGAAGCTSPLAARESGRDLVYLVAGSRGGAAVRYFGGTDYRRRPEVLQLPNAGLLQIREVAQKLDLVGQAAAEDLVARSALIDQAREAVGHAIAGPILERWPGRQKLTIVPIGEIQEVPFSTATVGGQRLNAMIDITIAPNAALVLLASGARVEPAERVARVLADPANGEIALPWVVEEAYQVAAVYGQQPDLVVDYGAPTPDIPTAVRMAGTSTPSLNLTSEHVLSQIEDARIVHLACHGFVPKEMGLPGLLLHGILTFDALEHHRFADGSTVVLSACSVGRSISEAPYAQLGFPAMLLSTGASVVIASSQPLIDCQQTVEFMVALHRHLRDGMTAVDALDRAIAVLERKGIPSAIWGSFEVHGAPPNMP